MAVGDFLREAANDRFAEVGLAARFTETELYVRGADETAADNIELAASLGNFDDYEYIAALLRGTSTSTPSEPLLTALTTLISPALYGHQGEVSGSRADLTTLMGRGVIAPAFANNVMLVEAGGYDPRPRNYTIEKVWGYRHELVEGASGSTDTPAKTGARDATGGILQVAANDTFAHRKLAVGTKRTQLYTPPALYSGNGIPAGSFNLAASIDLRDYQGIFFVLRDHEQAGSSIPATTGMVHGRQILRASQPTELNLDSSSHVPAGENVLPLYIAGGAAVMFLSAVENADGTTTITHSYRGTIQTSIVNSRFGIISMHGFSYELFDPDGV